MPFYTAGQGAGGDVYRLLRSPHKPNANDPRAPGIPQVILVEIAGWAGRIVDVVSLKPGDQIVELEVRQTTRESTERRALPDG